METVYIFTEYVNWYIFKTDCNKLHVHLNPWSTFKWNKGGTVNKSMGGIKSNAKSNSIQKNSEKWGGGKQNARKATNSKIIELN